MPGYMPGEGMLHLRFDRRNRIKYLVARCGGQFVWQTSHLKISPETERDIPDLASKKHK